MSPKGASSALSFQSEFKTYTYADVFKLAPELFDNSFPHSVLTRHPIKKINTLGNYA
jgi:hypothetical protein